MTQTVPATCVLGPGLTGLTIGLRVLNLDGTTYAAFSTTGVAETSTAGTYRKAGGVVAPLAGGYIVWGTALVDYAEATVESAAVNVTMWNSGALPQVAEKSDVSSLGSIQNDTSKVASTLELIGESTYRFKTSALYNIVGADGDTLEMLSDQLDSGFAAISVPSAAAIADAVWDEALAGHATAGSTGAALSSAGAAGDVWATELPGAYTGTDAGAILGRLAALDTTAVTQVAASSAGHLTITTALTFDEAVTGLVIPSDWTAALWTLKADASKADTAALVQLRVTNPAALTDGLQRLNGAAVASPLTAASGSLTVTQASGRIDIYLTDEATALLGAATGLGWDVKFIDASGDSTGYSGTADVALTETKATA